MFICIKFIYIFFWSSKFTFGNLCYKSNHSDYKDMWVFVAIYLEVTEN